MIDTSRCRVCDVPNERLPVKPHRITFFRAPLWPINRCWWIDWLCVPCLVWTWERLGPFECATFYPPLDLDVPAQ